MGKIKKIKEPFEIKLSYELPVKRTQHFNIYYYINSVAENEIDEILLIRENAYSMICDLIGMKLSSKVDIYLFDDSETKAKETKHNGAGWAFGTTIVEIYNKTTKVNPFHELIHIIADGIYGEVNSAFSEGFAVYVSDLLENPNIKEYRDRKYNKKVIEYFNNNQLFSLEKLLSFEIGSSISKPVISYAQAASLIGYLYSYLGKEKFFKLYSSLTNQYEESSVKKNIVLIEEFLKCSIKELRTLWLENISQKKTMIINTYKADKVELIRLADEMCELTTKAMNSSYKIESNSFEKNKWKLTYIESINNNVDYIICKDSKIRGYISWEIREQIICINDLMIHPNHQKDGVTIKKILKCFKNEISTIKYNLIIAYSNNKNILMQKSLIKVGFKIYEEKANGKMYSISKDTFNNIVRGLKI